jgi:hypothetical protein
MANVKARAGPRRNKAKGTMDRVGKSVVAAAHSGISVAQGPLAGEEEEEDSVVGPGSNRLTEAVYDLIDQTRGLLLLAHRQGLQLFRAADEIQHEPYTPSKTKGKGGRLSALTSPIATRVRPADTATATPARSLHRRLIEILGEIIMDDCLHQVALFRPSLPPNALQAGCLDIANFLFHTGDLLTQIEVFGMVIDGLYTMPASMTERICLWIEARLSELLDVVSAKRGLPANLSRQDVNGEPLVR